MLEIQVTCPGCSKKYKVKGTLEVLRNEPFICKCGFRAPFSAIYNFHNGGVIDTPPPPPPPPGGGGQKTQIHTPETKKVQGGQPTGTTTPSLFVPSYNIRVQLHSGSQTVGRKSSDSTADLKLAPDLYMSRQHALIREVMKDGKKFFVLEALKAENPVFINKKAYFPGTKIILKNGCTMVMGKTQVIFENK